MAMASTKMTSNEKLKILLDLAKRGYKIFPCKGLRFPGEEKQPLTKNGVKDATTNTRQIRAWHKAFPHAWWGMSTEHFTVIDQDIKKDKNGIEETKTLEYNWGKLPKTRIHRTPSGGRHIFLQPIPGMGNSTDKIALGVDIRGEGGYVCIPPSEGYTVEVNVAYEKVAKSPKAWTAGLKEKQKKKVTDIHTKEPYQRGQATVPEGQRDDYLTSIAGSMHNIVGLPEEAIELALTYIRDNVCEKSDDPRDDVTDSKIHGLAFREAFLNPEQYEVQAEAGEFDIKPKHLNGLYRRKFKPIMWLVEGMIPEGLGVTGARPKMGKSRFWWSIAYAIATGTPALGKYNVTQGKVLYIAIDEHSERLLRDRCKIMQFKGTDNLLYEVRDVPRIDENFIGYLKQYKQMIPELVLVVVDTMAHIKPEKKAHQNDYDFETRVWSGLQAFCHDNHMHVHLIHHLRKTQSEEHVLDLLGSTALAAKVDVVVTVRQDKKERGAILSVTGRETPGVTCDMILEPNTGVWQFASEARPGTRVASKGTLDVWEVLRDGPLSIAQVSEKLGKSVDTMRRKLHRMEESGEIKSLKQGRILLYYMGELDIGKVSQ